MTAIIEDIEAKGINLHSLIGFKANSNRLKQQLNSLLNSTSSTIPKGEGGEPEELIPIIKAFSDSVYYNYYSLGLSLVFEPKKGYKPTKINSTREELNESELTLISIDIYNHEAKLEPPTNPNASKSRSSTSTTTKPTFSSFPSYPILITYPSISSPFTPQTLSITPSTTGKTFTQTLGEPDRKGGGEGSIGIWVEWTSNGLLVEFASGGLQAWEKGGEAIWRVITIFERGVQMGKDDNDE